MLSRLAPTVVFCGSSVVSFGSAVQINGSQDLNAFVQINGSQDLNAFITAIKSVSFDLLGFFFGIFPCYRSFSRSVATRSQRARYARSLSLDFALVIS
ncbi:MAG: hypothetical protein GPJ04_23065 [Microcystis aeruginosa G13-03]|nr:hypothetical protein [Microcystis aeruginosa G13-03]